MIDINDLHLQRDMLHAHGGNVMRLVEGFRNDDRHFDGAALRLTIANARNVAETFLSTLDAVEIECKGHLTARCRPLFASVPAAPRPRPGIRTGVPVTVSPAGAA